MCRIYMPIKTLWCSGCDYRQLPRGSGFEPRVKQRFPLTFEVFGFLYGLQRLISLSRLMSYLSKLTTTLELL
jgi:hypothetical protein